MLYELIADFGMEIFTLIFGTIGAVLMRKFVTAKIDNEKVSQIVGRLYTAGTDAARYVWSTYVQAIKQGKADGKLTDGEKAEARRRWIDAMKNYLGEQGISDVLWALGLRDERELEKALAGIRESSVEASKNAASASGRGRKLVPGAELKPVPS